MKMRVFPPSQLQDLIWMHEEFFLYTQEASGSNGDSHTHPTEYILYPVIILFGVNVTSFLVLDWHNGRGHCMVI